MLIIAPTFIAELVPAKHQTLHKRLRNMRKETSRLQRRKEEEKNAEQEDEEEEDDEEETLTTKAPTT